MPGREDARSIALVLLAGRASVNPFVQAGVPFAEPFGERPVPIPGGTSEIGACCKPAEYVG